VILTHVVMFRFLGGASVGEPVIPPVTFNNSTQNWLSPSMHLTLLLGVFLYLRMIP
jgi:hypothetical protein